MTWEVTDGTNTYAVADLSIKKTVNALNTARLSSPSLIDLDTLLTINYNGVAVFQGYVKNRKIDESNFYTYDIVEKAVELETQQTTDANGNYVFTLYNQTVDSIVDTILTNSGWTRGSTDTTIIPAISFNYSNKLSALYKLLIDFLGYKVWFDSTTNTVYFGQNNTDRGVVSYITKEEETGTYKRNVTKVIVFSNDETVYGSYGTADTSVVVYKYADAKTVDECNQIAQRIYNDISNPYNRITVKLKPTPEINEADLVTVDGTSYTVYTATTTMFETTLDLNNNAKTIFDILGSKLIEMTGSVKVGKKSKGTYDGGWQNVGSTTPAYYNISIGDVNLIESFVIDIQLDQYKKFLTASGAGGGYYGSTSDAANIVVDSGASNVSVDYLNTPSVARSSSVKLIPDTSLPYNSSWSMTTTLTGYAFGIAIAAATIYNDGTSTQIYDVGIYYVDDSGNTQSMGYSYAEVEPGDKETITVVGVFPGSSSAGSRTIGVDIYEVFSAGGFLERLTVEAFFIGRHTHPILDSLHDHTNTDPAHNHTTPLTDHTHPETDDVSTVATYPSNVEVYVNGTLVATNAGGAATTFSVDITQYLTSGVNELKIVSSTAGSVNVSGEYVGVVFV